jgi:hypothetical protein
MFGVGKNSISMGYLISFTIFGVYIIFGVGSW